MKISANHMADLKSSRLGDETIASAGIYSEDDPRKNAKLLNWSRSADCLGECLVFPYLELGGKLGNFAMLKPTTPRTLGDKVNKYEHPAGVPSRPYFTHAALSEADLPSSYLLITEGQKKSLAAAQAGIPTIGLTGPWGWQKKREDKTKPRKLVDDLAAIDWSGQAVVLIFDTDPRRNSGVEHGLAELARVLAEHGADVHIMHLPVGSHDADGVPEKVGIDDFILAHGPAALHDLIDATLAPRTTRTLENYRHKIAMQRLDSVGNPGIYLDTSPTGSGKSYADAAACQKAGHSLTLQATHKQCAATEGEYQRSGMAAVAYPALTSKTCDNYSEAARAMDHGLSASGAICPGCPHRDTCEYQTILAEAEAADHRIATHHRGAFCMNGLAGGRNYISIHEGFTDLLRPKIEVSAGLKKVADLAYECRIAAGKIYGAKERATAQYFYLKMERIASELDDELSSRTTTDQIDRPVIAAAPFGCETQLFRAMKEAKIWPDPEALRLVKSLAEGRISELATKVDKVHKKGGNDVFTTRKSIIAFRQTRFPEGATVWLSDATSGHGEIEILAGRTVKDCTPAGNIEQQHVTIQIPTDIKKSTAPSKVVGLIRATLAAIPDNFHRIGVICHQKHVPTIRGTSRSGPTLDKKDQGRIEKVEHFRGGDSPGSNAWLEDCDLLIVFGTPRVPPGAIKARLIQMGKVAAACRDDDWIALGGRLLEWNDAVGKAADRQRIRLPRPRLAIRLPGRRGRRTKTGNWSRSRHLRERNPGDHSH